MTVWQKHREAYEASIKAQEAVYAADLALEDARRAVIQHVAEAVGSEDGFVNRVIDPANGDPLTDFVKAAESRYAETLGMYKPRKPLQIEIMNPRSLDTGEPAGIGEAPFDTGSVI